MPQKNVLLPLESYYYLIKIMQNCSIVACHYYYKIKCHKQTMKWWLQNLCPSLPHRNSTVNVWVIGNLMHSLTWEPRSPYRHCACHAQFICQVQCTAWHKHYCCLSVVCARRCKILQGISLSIFMIETCENVLWNEPIILIMAILKITRLKIHFSHPSNHPDCSSYILFIL